MVLFYNPREVLDELKKYIAGYEKNQNVYPEYLQDKTNKAIENAKKMEKHCLDSGHTHIQWPFLLAPIYIYIIRNFFKQVCQVRRKMNLCDIYLFKKL